MQRELQQYRQTYGLMQNGYLLVELVQQTERDMDGPEYLAGAYADSWVVAPNSNCDESVDHSD
jgi:hypothetical protein